MKYAIALTLALIAPFAQATVNPDAPNFLMCQGGKSSATRIKIAGGLLTMAGAGPNVKVKLTKPTVEQIPTYKNEDLTASGQTPRFNYVSGGYTVSMMASGGEIPEQYTVWISKASGLSIFSGYCFEN